MGGAWKNKVNWVDTTSQKQRNKNSDVFPFQKKGTKMESFQVGGSCSKGGEATKKPSLQFFTVWTVQTAGGRAQKDWGWK